MKYLRNSTLFFLLVFSTTLFAQIPSSIPVQLDWATDPSEASIGVESIRVWRFEGGVFLDNKYLPYYSKRIALPSHGKLNAQVFYNSSTNFDPKGVEVNITNDKPIVKVIYETERHHYFARITVFPVFKNGGQLAKLEQSKIALNFVKTPRPTLSRGTPTKVSKLTDGEIFKFSITQNGIHKINANFLKELGVDLASVNPRNIQLLGNGGARLPELIAKERIDDLAENAIFVSGETDGKFDDNDFILFYATGPKPVNFEGGSLYHVRPNPYADEAYYYIKIGNKKGARINNKKSLNVSSFSTKEFLDCQRYELDKVNLLDLNASSEGGGNEWFGELFKVEKTKTFNDKFNFPNVIKDKKATVSVRFAANSSTTTSLSIKVEDETFQRSFSGITGSWPDAARVPTITSTFFPKGNKPSIKLLYNEAGISDAEGYLDYIEINAYRALKYDGTPLYFGSLSEANRDTTTFNIQSGGQELSVWDVTTGTTPLNFNSTLSAGEVVFTAKTETVKKYVAFKTTDNFPTPSAIGKINNQNVHGIEQANLVIVYHPSLKAEAEKLGAHRSAVSDMGVKIVDVNEIFNEFSSGVPTPTGIRDFAKMLYDRDPNFKYLLLLGDGSFDHRNINNRDPYYNLIPVRETQISILPINTFPSDDFFALLSADEGKANLEGALDIAVGRITAETPEVANAIIEKIIYYDTAPETLKPWRTKVMCIGDDGDHADGVIHMRQTNETADLTESTHPFFVATKVLLDAFPQVPAPYGQRIPEASKKINEEVMNGTLVINYFGHGGANGLAQERVLTLQSVSKWVNIKNHLPLVITASCSTSGFDDPSIKTFGEELLKNPIGGAIALFSTVRPVYSSYNEALIDSTFPEIFIREPESNKKRTIGEILRIGKNKSGTGSKSRKFLLLGDPSMQIAIPDDNRIVTDKINGIAPQSVDSVPIQALTKVTIEGHIANNQGQLLTDFNGLVYMTFYDKTVLYKTLGTDNPTFPYMAPRGIIFKGNATVKNGKYQFSFVVPKDVTSHGFGQIKYYASDLVSRDAAGYEAKIYIGGTNGEIIVDDTPPTVDLFMNDDSFVDGGITNNHPTIYAKLADDNGINISGSGIGHDLTAVIDDEIKVVNNYYEADEDVYTHGKLRYPLDDLAIGEHTITVKAWDVANNLGQDKITFVVANSDEAALNHVLNYPNPFTDNTRFQFEHNLAGSIKARIDIYSTDGKVIKTIDKDIQVAGFRVADIQWDGKDDYGDQLAKGVYIYKVKITSLEQDGKSVSSDFEKLVIMK